jgi:NADH:ubiquinone oxidoreductase subunit 6 (subunit J)
MKKRITKSLLATGASLGSMLGTAQLAMAQILPEAAPEDAGFFTSFENLFSRVLTIVMVLAALLVLFYLVWGGIDWITSGGDKGKTESARNKITAAVIGLIIVAASYAIFQLVLTFLGTSATELNSNFGSAAGG